MTHGLTLRAATEADAAFVLPMVRAQLREENPAAAFSPGRARDAFEACLERGAVIVSTYEGQVAPVASCGLIQEPLPFSDEAMLRMLWCFVRLEHRRAAHMRELLRAAIAMGHAAGLPVHVECPGGDALRGKIGLLRREFGESGGVTFLVRS
jgi:hypothetical protein